MLRRYYEIAVGYTLYDCAPHELELADPPSYKPSLLKGAAVTPSGTAKQIAAGTGGNVVAEVSVSGTRSAQPSAANESADQAVKLCGGCAGAKKGTLRCTRCFSRWYCSKVMHDICM